MNIKKENKEIIIKLNENKDKYLYNEMNKEGLENYLTYLVSLDNQLRGSEDSILYVYESIDNYSNKMKEKTYIERKNKLDSVLDDMVRYIKYIDKEIPREYKRGFKMNDGTLNIPEDSIIDYLMMITERLMILRQLINKE